MRFLEFELKDLKMSYQLVVGGLALGGLGLYGVKYALKNRRLAIEANRIRGLEEEGAKKANSTLLSSTYYADLDNLRKELDGQVILPSDGEKYHECRRRAFNQSQRGFPAVIVRVRGTNDVVKCINFVNKHRKALNLCVACGCHSSKCMMNDAFVIDLFHMNKVQLDKDNMTVTVEGGAYLEEIDKALQPHNFGTPVGTYPQTGVGGLVLGGGYGFLARMHGFSVDNLLETEVVLPTGEVVVANDQSYSDLIWGLRGGSGNFGVVTKFKFRVYKLPTYCHSGVVVDLVPTFGAALKVATNFDKLISQMPNEMQAMLVFAGGAPVAPSLWAHFGEEKHPSEVPELQKAKQLGGWFVVQNSIKTNSYHNDLQRITTPMITSGFLYHTLIQFGELGKELPVEFWERLLTHTRAKIHPALKSAAMVVFCMGGVMATNDKNGEKTCLTQSIRSARFFAIMEIYWKPECGEEGKAAARDWAKKATEIIKPYNNEALRYAAADNSVSGADIVERDQTGYGMDRYPKLQALKKKYDPTNLFKNNVNIAPSD